MLKIQNKLDYMKKYLNWQILLIVFVNLFLANMYPHGVFIVAYFTIPFLFNEHGTVIQELMLILALLLLIVRLFWLPILYKKLEKYSKNELVQKFIFNLKNNGTFRWKMLCIVEIPLICYCLFKLISVVLNGWQIGAGFNYADYSTINWISYRNQLLNVSCELSIMVLMTMIFFDLFGSYLALFLWWKIRGELK